MHLQLPNRIDKGIAQIGGGPLGGILLAAVALVGVFLLAGATPAALGLLADISNVVADHKISILAAHVTVQPDQKALVQATISVTSVAAKRSRISFCLSAFSIAPASALVASGGMLAGPNMPAQARMSKPGITVSLNVGTSGNAGLRSFVSTASGRMVFA